MSAKKSFREKTQLVMRVLNLSLQIFVKLARLSIPCFSSFLVKEEGSGGGRVKVILLTNIKPHHLYDDVVIIILVIVIILFIIVYKRW